MRSQTLVSQTERDVSVGRNAHVLMGCKKRDINYVGIVHMKYNAQDRFVDIQCFRLITGVEMIIKKFQVLITFLCGPILALSTATITSRRRT